MCVDRNTDRIKFFEELSDVLVDDYWQVRAEKDAMRSSNEKGAARRMTWLEQGVARYCDWRDNCMYQYDEATKEWYPRRNGLRDMSMGAGDCTDMTRKAKSSTQKSLYAMKKWSHAFQALPLKSHKLETRPQRGLMEMRKTSSATLTL